MHEINKYTTNTDHSNINYPTLKEYFSKYNINYLNNISHKKYYLDNLYKNTIESRGDGMGIVVIDYANYNSEDDMSNWKGSYELYNFSNLLEIKVVISSWNYYTWNDEWNEKEIIENLYTRY